MRIIAEASCLLCVIASLTGNICLLRAHPRRGWFFPLGLAFVLLTGWVASVAMYLGAPYTVRAMRVTLVLACIALGPWLWVALTSGAGSVRVTTRRWKILLAACAAATVISSIVMWWDGIDWVTGIGPQPTTVLTRGAVLAMAVALMPSLCAVVVFATRLPADLGTMPGVSVGTVGAVGSVVWVALSILRRGYLTPRPLTSAVALAAVATVIWAVSVLRRLPAARPLSPARPVVYGAAALSLVIGYVAIARFAFHLMAPLAAALPEMLPALAFAATAGLVVSLGSRRFRHRLWVLVGRSVFRSKHDYGAVWVRLTRLVTEARSAPDLVQRVAVFCRDLLCVDTISVYLYDPAGMLRLAAFAGAGRARPPLRTATGLAVEGQLGREADADDATATDQLAARIAAGFVCPMRVNGHRLGFIAVGEGGEKLVLDEEDHQVMDYISAQIASALGLYRFGEEIADAREVGSFQRLSAFIIHDLKNLVAQQSFVLENARKFGADPAFVADALDAFADSTSRMRSLITRLRTNETSAPSPSPSCDILDLIRELTSGPRLTLPGGCSLRLTVPDGVVACHVRADRSALTQVFTNLLVNAVESLASDRGEIEIAVQRLGMVWRIDVSDNGCGIPESYLREHLFRPFRSTKDGGMGIGLYQCKVVVEAAGGNIRVSSQPAIPIGTKVTVQLPVASLPADEGDHQTEGARVPYGETDRARG